MQRASIGLGVDGHSADAELAERPEDPDRDLTSVGDENLREGGHEPAYSVASVSFPDQLTLARVAAVPVVIVLFGWDFHGHDYWATAVFGVAMLTDWLDGWWARRSERSSDLGRLLDPVADKLLVLAALIMLVDQGVLPGWMIAAIVAREFLVSGLRLAALERGIVVGARDLGKLKTWSQAVAAGIGGFAAGGALSERVAWWAALVALALTWISGLDYARLAPGLLRGRQPA
ncbi:MAG: CDP-diacylglycerol--glycerol-3-phosphate 3-phosphatidyltransferase [Actinobacteria bacterium]|nr:MAG: CDP-diacylglycerol--glycerol-3-phosphate 3-phosphatidyltransferase [Actinomycetota bacterium]